VLGALFVQANWHIKIGRIKKLAMLMHICIQDFTTAFKRQCKGIVKNRH